MSPPRKSVLITGCSEGGIGAALAEAFHHTGRYHVFATARNTPKLPESLRDAANVTFLSLDVTSKESIDAAVEKVSMITEGRLDFLVNNSGSGLTAAALDSEIEAAKWVFEVNYFGVLSVTQAFAPLLVKAKGCLVNNSSVSSEAPDLYQSIYSSSKAAITMQSECLRLELAPLGIRVITLITGVIETKFFEKQQAPEVPEGSYYKALEGFLARRAQGDNGASKTPADVYAREVVRMVENPKTKGKVYAGSLSWVFKWVGWWLPTWVVDRIMLSRNPLPPAPKV